MIDCSSMAVDCQREGKEEETAEKPYDSNTMGQEDGFVALHSKDISETGLPFVNPALVLQLFPYPMYHLTMERDTRQRRAIRHVIEEAGRPLRWCCML